MLRSGFRGSWLLLLAVCSAGALYAQPPSDPPLAFRRVLVPPEQSEQLLQREKETLHPVPPQQFEKLLSVVQNAPVLAREAVSTRLVRSEHTLRYLPEGTLQGTSRLWIEHQAAHPVLLPLAPLNVALQEARWVGQNQIPRPAVLGIGPRGRVLLLVERGGQLELLWQLRANRRLPQGSRFVLQLPAVPRQTLRVQAPRETQLRIDPPALIQREPSPSAQPGSAPPSAPPWQWRVQPPAVSTLVLELQKRTRPSDVVPSYRQVNQVQLAPQGLQLITTVRFQGTVPEPPLQFRLPENLEVMQVELADQKVAFRRLGTGILQLDSSPGLLPGQAVRIRAAAPWELDRPASLPRIIPLQARWQSEQTHLQLLAPLVLKHWRLTHCRQTAPWTGQTTTVEHFGPQGSIELVVGQPETRQRIRQAVHIEMVPGTLQAEVVLEVLPQQGELFHLEAVLEPGWTLDRVETEPAQLLRHWHLEEGRQGRRRLHLELERPLSPESPGRFRLELHQRLIQRRGALPLKWLWPLTFSDQQYPEARWLAIRSGQGGPLRVRSPLLHRPLQDDERNQVSRLLPELSGQDLVWRLPPGELVGEAFLVPARTEFLLSVEQQLRLRGRQWTLLAELRLEPQSGEVEHLELLVTPQASLPELLGSGSEPPRLVPLPADPDRPDGTVGRFRLVFPQPVRTPTTLQLRWHGRWNKHSPLQVPLLGVANGQAGQASIRLLARGWLPLSWKTSALIASTGEVSAGRTNPWRQLAAWSYDPRRLAEQPELFSLILQREDELSWQRPVVWHLQVDTLWDAPAQHLEHRCRLLLDYPASGRLEFSLPPGVEVTALSVDGRPQQWHLEQRRLHVQVPPGKAFGKVMQLEFWLQSRWSAGGFWEELGPPGLKCDYPILAARWTLWGDDQLQLPGPTQASLWQRWFGPLAGDAFGPETAGTGRSALPKPATTPGASHLGRVRHVLHSQLGSAAGPPADWGSWLLRAGQTLGQQDISLLIDREALARSGLGPRTALAAGSQQRELTLAQLEQQYGLKLVPVGGYVLLTTTRAEIPPRWLSSQLPKDQKPGVLPAHWVSPALWLWFSHTSAKQPWSWAVGSPQAAFPFRRIAQMDYAPGKELPRLALAWAPWWRLSGWVLGLALGLGLLWAGRRYPRATAAACVLWLWAATVAPSPWLFVTQRASWGVWAAIAALWIVVHRQRQLPAQQNAAAPAPSAAMLLLALGSLAAWHTLAQAQPAGNDGKGKVYSVYIPDEKQPEYYFVPEEFYRYLVEQADRLSRKPRAWLLQRASYRVMLPAGTEDPAEVLAFYYLRVFGVQESPVLDFSKLPEALRPERVSLSGMDVQAQWNDQGQLVVPVPEPGTYELELSFRPPVFRKDGVAQLQLPIPPALSARLEVLAGEEPVALEVAPSLGQVLPQARGELWRGELGPVGQLAIRWQAAGRQRPARLEADQLLWLRVHPGSVVLETQLHCRPLDTPLQQVEIWVDPWLQLIPPESPLVERFEWVPFDAEEPPADAPLPGVKLLRLQFREPVAGPVEVPLAFVLKDASGVGRWGFPLVQLRRTESLQYWIAVSVDRTLDYKESGRQGLQPLEAETFTALWNQVGDLPAVSYDCGNRYPFVYSLVTRPRSALPRVESSHFWSLYPGYAELVFQAHVESPQAATLCYRLHVPSELQLQNVQFRTRQSWKTAAWGRWGPEVVVWLPEAQPAVDIRLRGWMRIPPQGRWQVPAVDLVDTPSALRRIRIDHHGTLLVKPRSASHEKPTAARSSDGPLFPAAQWTLEPDQPWPQVELQPNRPQVSGQLDGAVVPNPPGQPWRIDYRFNFQVHQGVLPSIRFTARHVTREDVQLLSPGRLEFWSLAGQDDALVYYPEEPLRGREQVHLEIRWQPLPEKDSPLPQLVPQQVRPLQTYLLIPKLNADSPWRWRLRGLAPLALQGRPLAPVPRPRALRARNPRWQLVLQPRPLSRTPLRLLLAHHRLALDRTGQMVQHSLLLLSSPAGGTFLLEVPDRAEVLSVRLADQPALWQQKNDGTVAVRVPAGVLPQLVQVVARLGPFPLPGPGRSASREVPFVRPQDLPCESVAWSVVVPWELRPRIPSLSEASEPSLYRAWCNVLADQLSNVPAGNHLGLQRWWDALAGAIPLAPLPRELKEPQALPLPWHEPWLAQQTLQQALQEHNLRWPSLAASVFPLRDDRSPLVAVNAWGEGPLTLTIEHPAERPSPGGPWWLWPLGLLGLMAAVVLPGRVPLYGPRWLPWLLALAGLVWLMGLQPWVLGVALIVAAVFLAWQAPP